MPLPKISTPTHELVLPSTSKKIKYRPFLVKEEKVLILALESGDLRQITMGIKDVLSDCIITKGVDVESLPSFDIEYLFLNVRAKSVGEAIDLIVTCADDGETEVPVKIYVDEIQVVKSEEHTTDIRLDDKVVLRMKYPSLDQFIKNNFDFGGEESLTLLNSLLRLLQSVLILSLPKKMHAPAADCTRKELIEFIESVNSAQFKKIEEFFESMPKLAHTFKIKNPKTKKDNEVTLEGLSSFYQLCLIWILSILSNQFRFDTVP